jgi:hypothetical protein
MVENITKEIEWFFIAVAQRNLYKPVGKSFALANGSARYPSSSQPQLHS